MGKVTLILGGARSGKSSCAMKMANGRGLKRVAFVATGEALDDEMKKRVALHKKARPSGWRTFEEPKRVAGLIKDIGGRFELILVDCVTLLVSNLLLGGNSAKEIESQCRKIVSELRKAKADCIVVSNEVGFGIVPDNSLGRDFRDVAGRVNQIIAKEADEVFLTVAGIPWRLK